MAKHKVNFAEADMSVLDTGVLELNERRGIFHCIVDRYLATGAPIGSQLIADDLGNRLSPASIRAIMADLESAGLLFQPHISARRIPAQSGLRLFLDGLLELGGTISTSERNMLDMNYNAQGISFDEVLAETSTMLSGLTRCAGAGA